MNSSRECPLCQKKISNFLQHIRFRHDIIDTSALEDKIQKMEEQKNKKIQFAKYVEELQSKKKNKEISDESYRELITKWIKDNY